MIDGNTAAINQYLPQCEAQVYEQEWKFDYTEECIDAAMYQIEVQTYFMHEGNRYSLLDVFCDANPNTQMGVGDALKMLMLKENSEAYSDNLSEWARDELANWVNADKAYEKHVKDNEPQEP